MVVGLDKFGTHFADFTDQYVLIGGTATFLVLDDAGLDARMTRDLDDERSRTGSEKSWHSGHSILGTGPDYLQYL